MSVGTRVWTEALCPGRFQTRPCLSPDSCCKLACLVGSFWAHRVPGGPWGLANCWRKGCQGIIKNVKGSSVCPVLMSYIAGGRRLSLRRWWRLLRCLSADFLGAAWLPGQRKQPLSLARVAKGSRARVDSRGRRAVPVPQSCRPRSCPTP